MKKTLVVFLGLLVMASTSFAAETPSAGGETASSSRNKNEDWYWGFNLGGGKLRYKDDAAQDSAKTLADLPNVNHATYFFDLYFIWPLSGHNTAIGVSLGGVSDSYDVDNSTIELDLSSSILGFSAHHFFGENIGDGFFLRGDIGFASVSLRARDELGVRYSDESETGVGIRLGAGYSILLSDETRLPISLSYQNTFVSEDAGSNSVVLGVGLMF